MGGSRKIKRILLKAFPMFYFRVRNVGSRPLPKYRISVMKGPVDFEQGPHGQGTYATIKHADGRFLINEILHNAMALPLYSEGTRLLGLMIQHFFMEMPLANEVEIQLGGGRNVDYQVVSETDSTVLIKHSDGSRSYRGFEFRPIQDIDIYGNLCMIWELYYDDTQVLYDDRIGLDTSLKAGDRTKFVSMKLAKLFVNYLCGKAYYDNDRVKARYAIHRLLLKGKNDNEFTYRGFIITHKWDEYHVYENRHSVSLASKTLLANALNEIDNLLSDDV